VFRKKNRRGAYEFFLVPIYPHQVADIEQWPSPPSGYIQGGGVEVQLGPDHEFVFSFASMSFLELVKPDGEVVEGYFRSFDRNTGALTLSEQNMPQNTRKGIGTRSVRSFKKFAIDRLGNRHEIQRETRTWRGVACT
jgi:CRISPR-associated endonuclease Csn1